MACLKALTHSTSQPYGKSISFSEDTSTPQMRQVRCNLIGKSHSLPLELYPHLKSAKSNRDLFGCESCHPAEDLDNMFHNLNSCVNRMCANMMPMVKESNNFILSAFTAPAVLERSSCAQQGLLVKTAAPAVDEMSAGAQQSLLVKTAAPAVNEMSAGAQQSLVKTAAPAVNEMSAGAQQSLLVKTAAPAVNEMSAGAQQSLLVKTAASQPVNSSILENNSLAVATIDNTCNCAVLQETMQDNNTETPTASPSTGENNLTCGSNSNVTVESSQPIGMSSRYECLSDLSVDRCCLHESSHSSSNTQNCKLVMESKPTLGESTSQSALQPILNLTSVLSAPRKIVKKGRPSSKKQKKRQREKQKHGLQPLQTKQIPDSTHAGCDAEQRLHSQSMELVGDQRNKLDSSTVSPCNPKFETAHEAFNPTCTMTRLFGRLISCSEDENCFEDDDGDNENGSVSRHKEVPCPPIKGFGFSCSLDLDAIFKKTIPQSLFNARKKTVAEKKTDYALCNDNGFQKNVCQSSSEHDSFNNSSTTSALPVLKDADSCFFTPALSLDILFCKKPTSCSQAAVDLQETFDLHDDLPSDENVDLLPSSLGPDSESLKKINALWNENYPTAGFRSCSSVSADEIQHPKIKVNFAAEPHFLTVHIVGTEERNGNWHHVIRERENFERRILELEQILTPVLEASHRAKVLEQRKSHEQQ